MIRRILVFLALIFVSFFIWRWIDKSAADDFLLKLKNFSFEKWAPKYTTTITDADGTQRVLDVDEDFVGGLTQEQEIKDDNEPSENDLLIDQILTEENLKNSLEYQETTTTPTIDLTRLNNLKESRSNQQSSTKTGVATLEPENLSDKITVPQESTPDNTPRIPSPSLQVSGNQFLELSEEDKKQALGILQWIFRR